MVLNITPSYIKFVGSMVSQVYCEDQDLDHIIKYCEQDVNTEAQIILQLQNEGLLDESKIIYIVIDYIGWYVINILLNESNLRESIFYCHCPLVLNYSFLGICPFLLSFWLF